MIKEQINTENITTSEEAFLMASIFRVLLESCHHNDSVRFLGWLRRPCLQTRLVSMDLENCMERGRLLRKQGK